MSRAELSCPQGSESCRFYGYCQITKARMESDAPPDDYAQAVLDQLTARIPAPLLEADGSTFCSEERIEAINTAAQELLQDPSLSDTDREKIQESATGLIEIITANRLHFTHSPTVEPSQPTDASNPEDGRRGFTPAYDLEPDEDSNRSTFYDD